LPVFVESAELLPMTLPELAELLPERALLAVLEGGRDALGVMALCPSLLASIIEMQAIGRVTSRPPANRRPTRTDAAISADFVNSLLAELGREIGDRPGIPAFGAFRYATHMDDPRPLGLMLEDGGCSGCS
jgi:flagellar motor switch protein FliM